MEKSLPVKRINHIEFLAGNALQASFFYRKILGFDQIAYLGPETGHPDCASYVLHQGRIRLVFTTPLKHDDPRQLFLLLHGDGVKDICFEVDDVEAMHRETLQRGAVSASPPHELRDAHGSVRCAAVRTYGEVIHSFVSTGNYTGPFLPGYEPAYLPGENVGFTCIDHIVGNIEDRQMDRWCDWYTQRFGLGRFVSYDDKDISTEYCALRTKVMAKTGATSNSP